MLNGPLRHVSAKEDMRYLIAKYPDGLAGLHIAETPTV